MHTDLSGVLSDAHGRPVQDALAGRIVAIDARRLRQVPNVIGIAYGPEKAPSARAAIRGGYLNSLVTHRAFAERLLSR